MLPCFNAPDSDQCIIGMLVQNLTIFRRDPFNLNQVCWSREASKTCRTAALEDRSLTTLSEIIKTPRVNLSYSYEKIDFNVFLFTITWNILCIKASVVVSFSPLSLRIVHGQLIRFSFLLNACRWTPACSPIPHCWQCRQAGTRWSIALATARHHSERIALDYTSFAFFMQNCLANLKTNINQWRRQIKL